jgi:hypothetical protein
MLPKFLKYPTTVKIYCIFLLALVAPCKSRALYRAIQLPSSHSLARFVFKDAGSLILNGSHDITLTGKLINGGTEPCITLKNCYNIHITKCKLQNSKTVGILLINCRNIIIDYNFITNVSTGVYATDSGAGGIAVNYNQFKNMQGPFPRGQFVQFNTISGAGCSISYNRGENIMGSSNPEDAISLYKSNGTASSPIKIIGNWIRGGGPSKSGGGIMLGDNGGSYQYAADNILVNPGQYGIAISGGDNNSIVNNRVYGKAQPFTNVGIYVWGQAGYKVTNATVSGNTVKWLNAAGEINSSWLGKDETTPRGWNNNKWRSDLSLSVLPEKILDL